jgi:hypothetical protein
MEVFFMKRAFGIILCITMALILFAIEAEAATTSDGFSYEIQADNTVVITKYTGTSTDLSIPSSIEGKSVTDIGNAAFSSCLILASITIPNSVVYIAPDAFSIMKSPVPSAFSTLNMIQLAFARCEDLTDIYVEPGNAIYEDIDGVLFDKSQKRLHIFPCGRVKTLVSYTIPEGTAIIGDYAFAGFGNLSDITIPDSVTSIGNYAFYGCRDLENVILPQGVASIGDYSFANCDALNEFIIPEGATSLGEGAFIDCDKLRDIHIPSSVVEIGGTLFTEVLHYIMVGDRPYLEYNDVTLWVQENSYAYEYYSKKGWIMGTNDEKVTDSENQSSQQIAEGDVLSNYRTLTVGSTGPDVARLKQRMYELGYFKTNTVNETFTATTAEYVKEFEITNGLLTDGIADPEMQALFYSDKAIPKP